MKNLLLRACTAALCYLAIPADAQVVTLPQVRNAGAANVPAQASVMVDSSGAEKGTTGNPEVVSCVTGCSSGGGSGTSGGTATAASPTYTEGSTAQPLSLDLTGYQRVRSKQDGSWSFSLTGTLPAFAATPTFNLGTAPSLTITNSSFGISGQLPAFAATPTFNLGALNGAATAPNQATIIANLGSPFQAGGSIGNTDLGADCDVVSGDQTWTAGTQHRATCTTTGRWKVGLSSAATIGATAATIADLAGTVDGSGNQRALMSDANSNLRIVARDANNVAPDYTAPSPIKGSVATGATITDPPVYIGCNVLSSLPSSYTTATGAFLTCDVKGRAASFLGFYGSSNNASSIFSQGGTGGDVLAVATAPTTATANATTDAHCTAACASVLVASATHNLYGVTFSSTAAGWLLIYDATSCSANGTVTPLRAYAYPTANVTQTVSWPSIPIKFANGIAACFSTTGPYSATSSTTAFIAVDYK